MSDGFTSLISPPPSLSYAYLFVFVCVFRADTDDKDVPKDGEPEPSRCRRRSLDHAAMVRREAPRGSWLDCRCFPSQEERTRTHAKNYGADKSRFRGWRTKNLERPDQAERRRITYFPPWYYFIRRRPLHLSLVLTPASPSPSSSPLRCRCPCCHRSACPRLTHCRLVSSRLVSSWLESAGAASCLFAREGASKPMRET